MKIPPAFTNAIADTFYDKQLTITKAEPQYTAIGSYAGDGGEVVDTVKGNIQRNTKKLSEAEFGYWEDATYRASMPTGTNIKNGYYVDIDGDPVTYVVKECVTLDSHILAMLKIKGEEVEAEDGE